MDRFSLSDSMSKSEPLASCRRVVNVCLGSPHELTSQFRCDDRLLQDQMNTVNRTMQMTSRGTVVTDFSGEHLNGTFPPVLMGMMDSGMYSLTNIQIFRDNHLLCNVRNAIYW